MNAMNIGFTSSHWIKLMESSKEYEFLSKAIDDGNESVIFNIYNTLLAIKEEELPTAMQLAQLTLKQVQAPSVQHAVDCPFCKGSGYLEIEYTPRNDPDYTKSVTALCTACGGVGTISPTKLFDEYAADAYPENAVSAILSKDFESAKQITSAVFNSIEQHRTEVEEESLDKHLRG